MPKVCLYFQIHQPRRLARFHPFARRRGDLRSSYFDYQTNHHYFKKAERQCYVPALSMLNSLVRETDLRLSFSVTGTFLEQAQEQSSEAIPLLQKLSDSGRVEFLCETSFHSLSSLFPDLHEFEEQVKLHKAAVRKTFSQNPRTFRNTELIYSNRIASAVRGMGFNAILAEGIERVLEWRSPNFVYRAPGIGLKLLFRNYRMSDDVGYRFSSREWSEWPLTAEKYCSWLSKAEGDLVNVFIDFETFGEHQWKDTGIFDFLEHLPREAEKQGIEFVTPGEASLEFADKGEISVPQETSWADLERDASAWLGNNLQKSCFKELVELEREVKSCGSEEFSWIWRNLQTSDQFYYLCTKSWADGDVHKYFSPHKEYGPYENFINLMNVIQDFKARVREFGADAENELKSGKKRKMLLAGKAVASA